MRIALFGNGAMGQLVGARAQQEGHEITATFTSLDAERPAAEIEPVLRACDVAVDFSIAAAVERNATLCAAAGLPLVEGTTGWVSSEVAVRDLIERSNTAIVYGANFSLGVNLFYRIVSRAGELFGGFPEYSAFITEAHHERKRDAPSGTALRLREVLGSIDKEIPIASTRAGSIPGTHVVGFDSIADQVTLKHEARSREGFAAGAILAANWIVGRQGVYEFSQMIDEMISARLRR